MDRVASPTEQLPHLDYLVAATAQSGEEVVLWHWDRDLTVICDHAGIAHEPEHEPATGNGIDGEPDFDGIVPAGTPLNWRADVSSLAKLGFSPSISLEQGIQSVANWCREELRDL